MLPSKTDKELIHKEIEKNVENGFFREKKVVVFGCTMYVRDIRDSLLHYGVQISAFIDNSEEKAGKDCLGIKVYSPKGYLKPYKIDAVIIICSKYDHEMTEQIKEMGYSPSCILNIRITESQRIAGDSIEVLEKEFTQITKGYALYQKLCEKYSQDFLFCVCPYPGTGDIYMACSYLGEYLLKKQIKNFVLIVTKNSCKRTAELFLISNIEVISQNEMQDILKAWEFLGNKVMQIKPLLYWGWRTKRYLYADKHPQITFTEMFLHDVYGLKDGTPRQLPYRNEESTFAYHLFDKLDLPKGRTIIIAPYAGSFESSVTMGQWKKLSDILALKGYVVCTNCFGEKEPPIQGTIGIIFPYDEAINVLEYAGGFIAVRSGLCDIVSSAKCQMAIIYENGFNASRYEYFSLKRMGLNSNVIEKIYTTEETILKLADEWEEHQDDKTVV